MQLFDAPAASPAPAPEPEQGSGSVTAPLGSPRDTFHASNLSEDEFMKAPAIHVGTYQQSAKMADLITEVTPAQKRAINEGWLEKEDISADKIHSTPISEHAKVYPVTLTDKQANRVHSRFLNQRDIKPTPSVAGSTIGYDGNKNFAESSLVEDRALAAMNRNEVIRYVNTRETPDDESDPHSFLVPSPVINMRQMSQRALPMDYSRIVESETTKNSKIKVRPESSKYDALATPTQDSMEEAMADWDKMDWL